MDSQKSRTAVLVVLGLVVALSANVFAQNETTIPGRQVMVAHYPRHAPVIDGVLRPSEWRDAKAVYIDGTTPTTAPGIVPSIGLPFLFPPDSPADSSFTIYTLYDNNNLYVAVDVLDDIVICDGPTPFLDDDVEIMVDGDREPGDVHMARVCGPGNPDCPNPVVNNEGFKLTTSACGDTLTDPSNNPNIIWESKAGRRPRAKSISVRTRSW